MRFPKFTIRTPILCAMAIAFLSWLMFVRLDPMYGFSREQYEDGYVTAFKMNGTGPAFMDYKREFWSCQIGFDDGIDDFREIYQHPNVGPFSYERADRLRDVITHIRKSKNLDAGLKKRILAEMQIDLKHWESRIKQSDSATD